MTPEQPLSTPSPNADPPKLTEEEIRRFAETGSADPPSPVNELNLSLTSRGGETQNSLASSITKALSFNKKLFVLQNSLISSDQAERFLAQAVTMGDSIDIQQTMTEAAMDTLDMKIRCDPSLKVLNRSEVSLWRTRLSHLQIARLVSQYFGKRHDEKKTLAEVFSKVKFKYCIDNEDHEILRPVLTRAGFRQSWNRFSIKFPTDPRFSDFFDFRQRFDRIFGRFSDRNAVGNRKLEI